MTDRMMLALWLLCGVARIPRIVERWSAPFLNGPGWFFGVRVAPAFFEGAGRSILTTFRLRLLLPWMIEIPICAVLFIAGYRHAVLAIGAITTLLTRLAFYANRTTSENAARRFHVPDANRPVVSVSLSLRPRTLHDYTNVWVESVIAASVLGSLALLVGASVESGDWHPTGRLWAATLMMIYVQFGLLLMKRGFVRAREAAPAENAEPYLAWRESLRRLSTAICDQMRLLSLWPPLVLSLAFLVDQWNGGTIEALNSVLIAAVAPGVMWFEWRRRQEHLAVARVTKPTGLLIKPDSTDLEGWVCFRPSLPILLLKGPHGYALNLASAPAMTGGLYFAGCALLLIGLARY